MESHTKDSHLLVLVGTLIEAAADRDNEVREAVTTSLRRIAKKHPSFVLRNAAAYRVRNPKISASHVITLLQMMEQICKEHLPDIDGDVVLMLIDFGMDEMMRISDYQPDQQLPASGILVALGQAHCNEVMGGLLKQFQPGILPHYTVLHTMGTLASANMFGIVPFIKATLGTMLPMMGMLRHDAMKQVFSYTLGKFSEAVSDYLANIDHAPDPTVKKEAFSSEVSIAYDVLATTWIHTREPKACETVLQAIGPMFSLLPAAKITEQVPRLIPILLGLYRRSVDPFPVTQCLSSVLNVALIHHKATVEPLLDNLQNVMFDLVCISPDYAQPATAKNHYEVLRCFDCIAGHFSDRVVEHLIQQLKNNNDRERIKSLFVVTHLVSSSENLIRSRISNLVVALKNMLGEHNVRVKKVLLKAIVAFAYRGYLDGTNGKEFVEFIVKHCCPQPVITVGKDSNVGNLMEELQVTCANTLYLLATTVPQIENTLWPVLLQCLLTSEYTSACSHVARCLAHLATKRKDQLNLTENSAKLAHDVTNPHVILGRCLALLGCPLNSGRGSYILHFLKNYAANIGRHLKPLWERKIPELVNLLEGDAKDMWDARVWEDLVLEFLSATLTEMDEEKWTVGLGVKLMEQTPLYQNYPEERGMLYKCLAITVCHTTDIQFINHQLDVMLGSMRQHSTSEGKACARAVGICTRNHLELVLLKLEKFGKEELTRKSSRLLGFMKDVKHEGEVERVRLTLLTCYGEVALEAPGTQLLPQLENGIAQWVVHQLQTAKDTAIREASLRTLGNIAEALHPNRNTLHVILQTRGEILNQTLAQLRPQYSNVSLNNRRLEMYPTVLRVAVALIKLPPSLTPEERVAVLRTCFDRVYNAAVVVAGEEDLNNTMDAGWAECMTVILDCLGSLVKELLLDSVSPATLDEIFTLLEPWLIKSSSCQRAAAMSTLLSILQCYLDNIKFGYEIPSKFSQSGFILGRVVPRCTDPNITVRQDAVDCVRLVLSLAACYEGHVADDNDRASDLSRVREKVHTGDPNELFNATNELAKIICVKLPRLQLMHFYESLLDGLLDTEASSSSGTSVVLNVLLKLHGGELYHQVNDILCNILERLMNIAYTQTRTGSIRAILALAHHHPKAVVMGLLHQPLPYDTSVAECWMVLAQDSTLPADIMEQFLQLLNSTALYDEEPDRDRLRIAAVQPLAAISAMHEMFKQATMQDIAVKKFPELFSILLIALGCYVGTSPPIHIPQRKKDKSIFIPNRNAYKLNPARIAGEAFKSFLLCSKCEPLAEALLQCTHMETGDSLISFIEMVPALAKAMCSRKPQSLPRVVTCLNQYGTSTFEPQRIVVAAFYAELVYLNTSGQAVLLDSIVNNLLNCLSDPSSVVRQLCLKGLSSVSRLSQEQKDRHCQPVLSALIQGLDDHDSGNNIPLEAMRGFSQMLQVVHVEHVQGVQISVALRIKPFFENENPNIREAAFRMFGDLAKYGGTDSKAAFQEQVSGNLVCLLLHLDDDCKSVVKACKYALRQVSPVLGAERINTMVQDHLIDTGNLHYSDFMIDLIKIMVEELPDLAPALVMNALVYIKSTWAVIRGNAAMFIGNLYGNIPSSDVASKVPMDMVCARLMQLMQDDNPTVRAKVAKALSHLVTV